jgi:histidinol-phosphate phosphatase family protein
MTNDRIPKALLPVSGVPIIFRQMRILQREGITRLSVLAGHLSSQLEQALAPEAQRLGLVLDVIIEHVPLGTAGCLTGLGYPTDDTFIVYGDILFDILLAPLHQFHRSKNALLTLVAHPNDHPRTSDLIIEHDGVVKNILPLGRNREHDHRNLVPSGLYLASPPFFGKVERDIKADMICDLLPRLVASGARLAVYNTPEYLRDVGSPARHQLAERDLAAGRVETMNLAHARPALFFDCDGVLNEEPGDKGAVTADDVNIIPGAGCALRRAREAGLFTIAVTNRPQVAKGFVTLEGLEHIFGRLEALLAQDGGILDRIYFCPHHPERGFPGEITELKIKCECRKPGTLLFRRAFAELPIDKGRSAMIGDSFRDIGAAKAIGLWAYGVRSGHGCRDQARYWRETGTAPLPDAMFENVSEAVDFAIRYSSRAEPIVKAVRDLLKIKPPPVLVAVCGRSRAGKSIIANAILRHLTEQNVTCLHVRLDDWIVPADQRTPGMSVEVRNRVGALKELVERLRAGDRVCAPGYDSETRARGQQVFYEPGDRSVILLEGIFASHSSIRKFLDYSVFVEVPLELQHARFIAFYSWKGFDETLIEALWQQRAQDEWPAIDTQRESANLVVSGLDHP